MSTRSLWYTSCQVARHPDKAMPTIHTVTLICDLAELPGTMGKRIYTRDRRLESHHPLLFSVSAVAHLLPLLLSPTSSSAAVALFCLDFFLPHLFSECPLGGPPLSSCGCHNLAASQRVAVLHMYVASSPFSQLIHHWFTGDEYHCFPLLSFITGLLVVNAILMRPCDHSFLASPNTNCPQTSAGAGDLCICYHSDACHNSNHNHNNRLSPAPPPSIHLLHHCLHTFPHPTPLTSHHLEFLSIHLHRSSEVFSSRTHFHLQVRRTGEGVLLG